MTEIDRILALPPRSGGAPPGLDAVLGALGPAATLRPAQRAFLADLWTSSRGTPSGGPRGAVGGLGCGHGKTLAALLAPAVAGDRRPALFVPAALRGQVATAAAEWRRRGWTFPDPAILAYEGISAPGGEARLWDLGPDVIVLDEAHLVGNPKSSRWRKLADYVAKNWSTTRVIVLSGTILGNSLGEARHLFAAALREGSPLPLDGTAETWATVLDPDTAPDALTRRALDPVVAWAVAGGVRVPSDPVAAARVAVRERIWSTVGAVTYPGTSADVSLGLYRLRPRPRSSEGSKALRDLEREWVLPDGTEIVDALEYHRAARSLDLGWYSVPPEGPPGYREARRKWAGIVRYLVDAGEFVAPSYVAAAAEAGRLGGYHLSAWRAWVAASKGVILGPSKVVWVDAGRVAAVVEDWRRARRPEAGALVWYQSIEVGAALGALGIPTHGAGSSEPVAALAAASRLVWGRGWEGQRYTEHLVLEPPSTGHEWEQLLARSHRPGQRRDVGVSVPWTPTSIGAVGAALADALYSEGLTGQRDRILLPWASLDVPGSGAGTFFADPLAPTSGVR